MVPRTEVYIMKIESPKNPNYAAIVVALDKFVPLAGADRIQGALIFGNQVIVGKDAKPGDVGLFFPVECQLSHEFVAANNLYRKPEWGNNEPLARPGFFEESRRVKAVKMRGHKSEGFFIPIASLAGVIPPAQDFPPIGSEFDILGGVEICRKYITKPVGIPSVGRDRVARKEDSLVAGQFHFHIDTENLRRNIHKLTPDAWISISDKWHGTSVIVSNVLARKKTNFFLQVLSKLGVPIRTSEYSRVWASRRVVKGIDVPKIGAQHFYEGEDIWGIAAAELFSLRAVEKGITIYAEIVGFTPGGSPIQSGYSYGCVPGTHRTLVYRITSTNEDGKVIEFSWNQIKAYTDKYGLEMVKELYFGRVIDLFTPGALGGTENHWHEGLLRLLENMYVHDQDCPWNVPGTPAEGIVVKVDRLDYDEAYKLKNFRFLEHETKLLDKGQGNLEDDQTELSYTEPRNLRILGPEDLTLEDFNA